MRILILILVGICLGKFISNGFNDWQYDDISNEEYPLKWYKFYIVKHWEEKFNDNNGNGINFCVKRMFKRYVLKYEIIMASRLNKNFDDIYTDFNSNKIK